MLRKFISLNFVKSISLHSAALRRAWNLVKQLRYTIGDAIRTAYAELREIGRVRITELYDAIVVHGVAWITYIDESGSIVDAVVQRPIASFDFTDGSYMTVRSLDNTTHTEIELNRLVTVCKY